MRRRETGRSEAELLDALTADGVPQNVRASLLKGLQGIATTASLPVLSESVGSLDQRTRVAAIRALQHVGSSEAVDVLIGAIRSTDYVTVGAAARALRTIRDWRAVPALIECLEQRWDTLERPARGWVLLALASMADPGAVDVLRLGLLDANRKIRLTAAQGLVYVGTPKAHRALDATLAESSWLRRRELIRATRTANAKMAKL